MFFCYKIHNYPLIITHLKNKTDGLFQNVMASKRNFCQQFKAKPNI